MPTNANNQDVVTLGAIAARRCAQSLDRLHELLAIEAMMLTQAMTSRGGPKGFARASTDLALMIRTRVPALTDDRPLADDIRRLSAWLDQPERADWLLGQARAAHSGTMHSLVRHPPVLLSTFLTVRTSPL